MLNRLSHIKKEYALQQKNSNINIFYLKKNLSLSSLVDFDGDSNILWIDTAIFDHDRRNWSITSVRL
jgi:hypothetical protein